MNVTADADQHGNRKFAMDIILCLKTQNVLYRHSWVLHIYLAMVNDLLHIALLSGCGRLLGNF